MVDALQPSVMTGFGVKDSRSSTGNDYPLLELAELPKFMANPTAVPKLEAQWIIPSSFCDGHGGRSAVAQSKQGTFHALTVDIDKGNLSRAEVVSKLNTACGSPVAMFVFSTATATPTDRKWRVIIPLVTPVPGIDYVATIKALHQITAQDGLIGDEKMESTNQIAFMPNVPFEDKDGVLFRDADGEPVFYEWENVKGDQLKLDYDHPISQLSVEIERAEIEADKQETEALKARITERKAKTRPGKRSPIEWFNASHDMHDYLPAMGWRVEIKNKKRTGRYQSPFQQSDSYATTVHDNKDGTQKLCTFSGSDAAEGLGREVKGSDKHCRFASNFDVLAIVEHGNDRDTALNAIMPDFVAAQRKEERGEFEIEGDEEAVSDNAEGLIPWFNGLELYEREPIPQEFLVEPFLPTKTLSLLSGEPGVGKSLLALDMAVSLALGTKPPIGTLGVQIAREGEDRCSDANKAEPRAVLYVAAEDDTNEITKRIHCFLKDMDLDREQSERLLRENLHIAPVAGMNPILFEWNSSTSSGATTKWFDGICEKIDLVQPDLIVLDTAPAFFYGKKNDDEPVRAFMDVLMPWTVAGATVLVLFHPSRTGVAAGTGHGGSSQWEGAARHRLFLEKKGSVCNLTVNKNNAGPTGMKARLSYDQGRLVAVPDGFQVETRVEDIEAFVTQMLDELNQNGVFPHMTKSSKQNYAPHLIAEDPRALELSLDPVSIQQAIAKMLKDGTLGTQSHYNETTRKRYQTVRTQPDHLSDLF